MMIDLRHIAARYIAAWHAWRASRVIDRLKAQRIHLLDAIADARRAHQRVKPIEKRLQQITHALLRAELRSRA